MKDIPVLYYSRHDNTHALVEAIAQGIEGIDGAQAHVRMVPTVSAVCEVTQSDTPDSDPPYVGIGGLKEYADLASGSFACFDNMVMPLKYFLDGTTPQWLAGALAGKPACAFASTGSMHGGWGTTLLLMMLPLLHHGMVVLGLPHQHSELLSTKASGTLHGPSYVVHHGDTVPLTVYGHMFATTMGQRLAQTVLKLAA